VIVMGILLAVAGIAEIWVGVVAEREADLVRHELSDEGLEQHRQDFEVARDTIHGLEDEVLPSVAATLGVTDAELRAQIAAGYPAVDRLLVEQPELLALAEGGLANLQAQQDAFQNADSLPAGSLPGWAGGVWSLILAAVVIACGAALLVARGTRLRRSALGGVALVAVLLIVLPLALGIPGKSADAQSVLDTLRPSEELVARTEAAFTTSDEGMREFDERLMPDVAAALGISREQLDAAMALQFPEVAANLEEVPAVLDRYEGRVAIRRDGNEDLETLKEIPVEELGWFGPAFGAALAAVCGVAWWATESRRRGAGADHVEQPRTPRGGRLGL
jgi:hypothetical protein